MHKYKIVPVSELENLNYDELADTNIATTRRSMDGQYAIVEFINTAMKTTGLMSHMETLAYLENHYLEWNPDPSDFSID
jgi:hypothetical protein